MSKEKKAFYIMNTLPQIAAAVAVYFLYVNFPKSPEMILYYFLLLIVGAFVAGWVLYSIAAILFRIFAPDKPDKK